VSEVSDSGVTWTIVGQGLAGSCLAWELWRRGVDFQMVDRECGLAASRVAAGLVNPVTGKNFEPSPMIGDFLPEALEFYRWIEENLGVALWHPMPIMRLAGNDDEWAKMRAKAVRTDVEVWVGRELAKQEIDGWLGGFEISGGGRFDVGSFVDRSREFFQAQGIYRKDEIRFDCDEMARVWCDGAVGLVSGRHGEARCAKGEILTVRAEGWDETRIRVGAGGWLVPLGEGCFKLGSTYEWDRLDMEPSKAGLERLRSLATKLGGADYHILAQEAGVRPILRRSEPLIGPMEAGGWMFNGLGSKGSLYAPGMARRLASWMLDGKGPEEHFDIRRFMGNRA
jgi:glycine/D-amino acid oxidase-like deaminating enzyme